MIAGAWSCFYFVLEKSKDCLACIFKYVPIHWLIFFLALKTFESIDSAHFVKPGGGGLPTLGYS